MTEVCSEPTLPSQPPLDRIQEPGNSLTCRASMLQEAACVQIECDCLIVSTCQRFGVGMGLQTCLSTQSSGYFTENAPRPDKKTEYTRLQYTLRYKHARLHDRFYHESPRMQPHDHSCACGEAQDCPLLFYYPAPTTFFFCLFLQSGVVMVTSLQHRRSKEKQEGNRNTRDPSLRVHL